MYWYDFGRNEVYVGSGGLFKHGRDCASVSQEEKAKIVAFFSEHLVKIYYGDERSYDNSDDERVTDSYSSSSSYVYRSVDTKQDLYGVVMKNGEITGIVFYVKNNSRDVYAKVFNFSGKPKNSMTLGYSASHSSSYTTVYRVELVKRGEGDAPTEASREVRFIQHAMYPEI